MPKLLINPLYALLYAYYSYRAWSILLLAVLIYFYAAQIESCSILDDLACAAVVAGCAVVCAGIEIDGPACIACCGGSYSTCKDCF